MEVNLLQYKLFLQIKNKSLFSRPKCEAAGTGQLKDLFDLIWRHVISFLDMEQIVMKKRCVSVKSFLLGDQ